MQEHHSLIHSLTAGEWQSLQQYLTCFSSHDSAQLKRLQLARILREAETSPTHNACCINIYGRKNEHGFDVIKSTLKEKVLDFLLTDISADKQQELDKVDYVLIKIKKKSAQFFQLYYSKKRLSVLYNLLDDVINLSRDYEFYALLADHLRTKKNMVSFKEGKEQFDKVNEEIKKYWQFNQVLNSAEHYYYELMLLNEYNGKKDKQKILLFLEDSIAEVGKGFELTKSPLVNYHLKFLELESFWLQKNYSKARSICLELLDVVRNNKSVYRRQRVGVVYDHLSRCDYYIDLFKHAAEHAREAQKQFNPGSENYCIALEQEFYALLALKENDNAVEIANKMISSASKKELGSFRYAKYHYLLANALFKQRRFKDALRILSQKLEISKDKAGWEIGLRVLKIMTLIETLKLNEASMAVGSLKQFISYTDKKTPVSQRDKTILALLCQVERVGFMFTLLNGNTEKNMQALLSGKDQKWEPFTHEVIPFHEWFAGKMVKGKRLMVNLKQPLATVPAGRPISH
jgi:tetratricopeptide (TPR) repeat protein